MSQPHLRMQPGYNEMALLHDQYMYKQLEIQRQKQLQKFGEAMQKSYPNQLPMIMRQAMSGQVPSSIGGTPIHDGRNSYINWTPGGASPDGLPQEQGRALYSVGPSTEQPDASLYGTPIFRGHFSQSSNAEGVPSDAANPVTNTSFNEAQKPIMQLSSFSNSFMGDNNVIPQEQISSPGEAFAPKQGFQTRNRFQRVPDQALSSGVTPENFERRKIVQRNIKVQEQTGFPGSLLEKTTRMGSSQGQDGLDPIEQKILFSVDENSWDASFGRGAATTHSGKSGSSEHSDHMNAFAYSLTGSYSALLQSAVAEASSNDTDLQEEWSGLTFQNTDMSTDNQTSIFVDSGNLQRGWGGHNMQGVSFCSKSSPDLSTSNMTSSFSGAKLSSAPIPSEQKKHQNSSHESVQQSHENEGKWFNIQPQKSPFEERRVQQLQQLEYQRSGQVFQNLNSVAHRERISVHGNDTQRISQQVEDINPLGYKEHIENSEEQTESRSMGKKQHWPDNGPQSSNHSYREADEISRSRQSCQQKENSSSDSFNSNSSQRASTGHEMRENLNANSYIPVTTRNQNSSHQGLSSQGLGSLEYDYLGQLKSATDVPKSALGLGKAFLPDFREKSISSARTESIGSYGPNISALTDRLPGLHDSSISAQMRQNREASTLPLFSSHGGQVPNPFASLAQSNYQSHVYQQSVSRFDSRRQHPPNSHHFHSSQDLPLTEKFPMEFVSAMSNQLHGQIMPNATGVSTWPDTVTRLPFNTHQSEHPPQAIFTQSSGQNLSVLKASQPSDMLKMPQQSGSLGRSLKVWTQRPTQQHLYDEHHMVPSIDQSNNNLESPSLQQELSERNFPKSGNEPSSVTDSDVSKGCQYKGNKPEEIRAHHLAMSEMLNTATQIGDLQNKFAASTLETHLHQSDCGKIQYGRNHDPALSARDLNAFSRPKKPLFDVRHDYSLLHQVKAIDNLNRRATEAFNSQNFQHAAHVTGQHSYQASERVDSESEINAARRLSPSDIRMERFMPGMKPASINYTTPTQEETAKFDWNYPRSHSNNTLLESDQMEKSENSSQMAPHWLKECENLKNGHMLPVYDTRLSTQQISSEMPSDGLHRHSLVEQTDATACNIDNAKPSLGNRLLGSKNLAIPNQSNLNSGDQTLAVIRSRKRKVEKPLLSPWHKEVADGSRTFRKIRMATEKWMGATNRLLHKVDDGVHVIKSDLPVVRGKRRLTMTTDLVQQLLRPPRSHVLQSDATSNNDSVLYSVAKLALADACSLTSHIEHVSESRMTKKLRGISNHDFTKALEGFAIRAKRLENDFLRLGKTVPVLELRLECQDMEKYSVMNRFAKFHGRAQADSTGASSSSYGTARPFLQKYVVAVPVPRILPEQMRCLPL